MKIQPLLANYIDRNQKTGVISRLQNANNCVISDWFIKFSNVTFGEHVESKIAKDIFNPLKIASDSAKLRDYAEILHNRPNNELLDMCYERYHSFLFGDCDVFRAYILLTSEIEKVREHKSECIKKVSELTKKEVNGLSNLTEQKINLKNQFINPLRYGSNHKNSKITNGILLYGSLNEIEKNSFVSWLKNEANEIGANFKNISYSAYNPQKSFEQIVSELSNAKHYNEVTGCHTILFIDGIDKLLTNVTDEESLDYIDYFKTLVEDSAKKNHVTFLIKSNLKINDFDSAAIGDQRFSIKSELKEGITPSELDKLKSLKKELERLDDQTFRVYKFYNHYTRYDKEDGLIDPDDYR